MQAITNETMCQQMRSVARVMKSLTLWANSEDFEVVTGNGKSGVARQFGDKTLNRALRESNRSATF